MTPESIYSGADLQAWLASLPVGSEEARDAVQRLAVAIAHRRAMRLLPYAMEVPAARLPALRAGLCSGIAAIRLSGWIIAAASRAADALSIGPVGTGLVRAAGVAAYAAAASVGASDSDDYSYTSEEAHFSDDADATWAAVRADCVAWAAGRRLEYLPLWPGESPARELWATIREPLLRSGAGWAFWIDWYDKAVAGEPQDWLGSLTNVAMVPERYWEKGADSVNALIARVLEIDAHGSPLPPESGAGVENNPDESAERGGAPIDEMRLKQALQATPNAERISFNEATGRFRADPITELPRDYLREVVDRLRDALRIFDGTPAQSNQFRAIEPERAIIAQAVERDSERPRMLHRACGRVLRRLDVKITNGECPDQESDADISDFYGTVRAVLVDLERDPLVKEAVVHSASAPFGDANQAEAENLVNAADKAVDLAEDALAEDLPEQGQVALDPSTPPSERKTALYIIASRLLRIYSWMRRGLAEAAAVSKDLAAVGAVGAFISIPLWLQTAVDVILRLLGVS